MDLKVKSLQKKATMKQTGLHKLGHTYALLCMLWLVIVADEEHSSTKRAAFSIAQSDDATTSRVKCELLASIFEEDFNNEKATPLKKEKTLTKKDGLCKSESSTGCSENCECVQIWRSGEPIYTCNCTKQEDFNNEKAIPFKKEEIHIKRMVCASQQTALVAVKIASVFKHGDLES
eukprot:gene9306-10287_t